MGDGSSKTWLVGRSLVTITTSGTGGGELGVCGRCRAIRRSLQPDVDATLTSNEAYLTKRRASLVGPEEPVPPSLCSCWCRGWAEIKVRRPTGNVAWLMRVQNKLDIQATSLLPTQADFDWSLMSVNAPETQKEEEEQECEEDEEQLTEEVEPECEEGWGMLTAEGEEFLCDEAPIKSTIVPRISRNEQMNTDTERANSREQTNGLKQTVDVEQSDKIKEADQVQLASAQAADIEQAASITGASITSEVCPVPTSVEEMKVTECPALQSDNNEQEGVHIVEDVQLKSSFAAGSHRQPTSHSWSESEVSSFLSHRTAARSFSLTCSSLNQLPPLFSYDEGDLLRRSPSLHTSGELSEPEQVGVA